MVKRTLAIAVTLLLACGAVWVGATTPPPLRQLLLSHAVTDQLGGETTRPLNAPNAFSFQAANARRKHLRPFSFGNRLFNTNWVEAPGSVKAFDGLGPLFNRVSCAACHTKDGRGQPPDTTAGPFDSVLLRLSVPGTDPHGGPMPVKNLGDQLNERAVYDALPEGHATISHSTIHGNYADGETFELERPVYGVRLQSGEPLASDVMISPRIAPQMIGLGLLEAVPANTLEQLTDPEDADGDGISGRLNVVWDSARQRQAIGRFGWKANQPDLLNQNAGAAFGDIGLTSSIHPKEQCDHSNAACRNLARFEAPDLDDSFLEKLTLYTASLAVPAQRNAPDKQVKSGGQLFRHMGCADCHVPTLISGPHSLPELANQTFHPFTDLLLHDMGPGLADGRPDFAASGSEWRTPPLWGLGLIPKVNGHQRLLHDGRARGFAEAILWHGGEAEKAKEAFRSAPQRERDALIAFLNSL